MGPSTTTAVGMVMGWLIGCISPDTALGVLLGVLGICIMVEHIIGPRLTPRDEEPRG